MSLESFRARYISIVIKSKLKRKYVRLKSNFSSNNSIIILLLNYQKTYIYFFNSIKNSKARKENFTFTYETLYHLF